MPALIITGPPGAGKSTVATLVAGRSPRSVCLEADWFWTAIAAGRIDPWLPEADEQNRTMLRSAAAAAAAMDEGGYDTVLEGIVGPWMLDVVRPVLGPLDYVVLRPDLDTCLSRATHRSAAPRVAGHPPLTDTGPIRHMWEEFSDLSELESHAIDTAGLSEAQSADAVLAARRSGELRL